MILGTGSKIQEMTKAFQKGNLQGAIHFCRGFWWIVATFA